MTILVTIGTLAVCGLGVAWMVKDINKTIEQMLKAEEERCEGKEEE